MANACIAETIPATDGVEAEYCNAPCNEDFCPEHSYLDAAAEFEIPDPDNAYDIERERDWELA